MKIQHPCVQMMLFVCSKKSKQKNTKKNYKLRKTAIILCDKNKTTNFKGVRFCSQQKFYLLFVLKKNKNEKRETDSCHWFGV